MNRLKHLDLSGCRFMLAWGSVRLGREWYLSGLNILRTFNHQNCMLTAKTFPQLEECERFERMLRGQNDFRDFIAANVEANIFDGCKNLIVLDLTECKLVDIPLRMFSALASLEILNLSQNGIKKLDLLLENCTRLATLNISGNLIEALSSNTMKHLDNVATKRLNRLSRDKLQVDLSGTRSAVSVTT